VLPLSSRLSTQRTADLCRRLAITAGAGVDARSTWERETAQAPLWLRPAFQHVRDAVAAGQTITSGLERSGETFPPLMRGMVDVGERTGQLAEVYRKLADYYRHRASARRAFLTSLAWPGFQLAMAVLVVGLLIWITGLIASAQGTEPIDLVGLGLSGNSGVATYFSVVGAIAVLLALLVGAMRRGVLWTRPVQRWTLRVPVLGRCLEQLALARMSWALALLMNVEMSFRQSVPLALRATGNDHYRRHTQSIVDRIAGGRELYEALRDSRAFPDDFLSAIEVGETSGQLVESMQHLSETYEDQARSSLAMLARLAGFGVWLVVAALLVTLIFRIFSVYAGAINDAGNF